MSKAVPSLVVLLLGLVASGCNLNLDLDEYPYRHRDASLREDAADASDTAPRDAHDAQPDVADTGDIRDEEQPQGKPYLIFSELMPDSSTPPEENVEYGEYIEVKNVGTAPADPRRIIIQLAGSDRRIQVDPFPSGERERQAFDALQPIEPGEYFVFVRQDTDHYRLTDALEAGDFYEYGRWFDAVPLSNSSRRLQLSYRTAEFHLVEHDAIEWAGHSLIDPTGESSASLAGREDVAWGLHRDFETAAQNNDPANWCYHTEAIAETSVHASPGQPTPANCSRE